MFRSSNANGSSGPGAIGMERKKVISFHCYVLSADLLFCRPWMRVLLFATSSTTGGLRARTRQTCRRLVPRKIRMLREAHRIWWAFEILADWNLSGWFQMSASAGGLGTAVSLYNSFQVSLERKWRMKCLWAVISRDSMSLKVWWFELDFVTEENIKCGFGYLGFGDYISHY